MSKFSSLVRRAPKRFSALVIMAAVAIIVPASLHAWGPDRPTFTVENPADHITFNSITNNGDYGDERNFVTIKDTATAGAGNWVDEISVQNDKEYAVRMYVHNNAASDLNLVAENVMAKFNLPTYEGTRVQIDGYLSSSNATPGTVYDQAVFSSATNFKLNYVPGSATYINNMHTGGIALPDSVVSTGAQLGYKTMDGKIPGCFQYSGYVTFRVKATKSDFDVQKTVRVNGATDKTFKESVTVNPGDKVDYQIYFKNSGGTQLKDVVIKDTLPTGVTYVPGSTQLATTAGVKTIADGVTTGGTIIGGFVPGGSAFVKFSATVASNDKLAICGPNTLVNVAKATTDVGSKEDAANVTVNKSCAPGKINVCNLSTKQVVTINESDFDSKKYTKDLSVCTPPELPHTGASENIVAFAGLGALIASVVYYVRSRRLAINL